MAITHKRQDDLESMFANFASFPKVSSDPEKEKESKKTIKFTDSVGREVEIPSNIEKIPSKSCKT